MIGLNFKKILLITAAVCITSHSAKAAMPVDISVNECLIDTSVHTFIEDGYTMVPLRMYGEILGCDEISWDSTSSSALLKNSDNSVRVFKDSDIAEINGTKTKMPSKCRLIDSKMYISARFLCGALNAAIEWNDKTHTVCIQKDSVSVDDKYIEKNYTQNDLDWLAKIVNAEAEGEEFNGKLAVANVVLNRKESNDFPNSVYDVIFDTDYGVQFTPTVNGAIHNTPSKESYKAAKQALFGNNTVGDALYFLNPDKAQSMWIVNNRKFLKTIGNHDFYL